MQRRAKTRRIKTKTTRQYLFALKQVFAHKKNPHRRSEARRGHLNVNPSLLLLLYQVRKLELHCAAKCFSFFSLSLIYVYSSLFFLLLSLSLVSFSYNSLPLPSCTSSLRVKQCRAVSSFRDRNALVRPPKDTLSVVADAFTLRANSRI